MIMATNKMMNKMTSYLRIDDELVLEALVNDGGGNDVDQPGDEDQHRERDDPAHGAALLAAEAHPTTRAREEEEKGEKEKEKEGRKKEWEERREKRGNPKQRGWGNGVGARAGGFFWDSHVDTLVRSFPR